MLLFQIKAFRHIKLGGHEQFNIRPLQPINKRIVKLYTLKEKSILPNLYFHANATNLKIGLNHK